MKFSAAREVEYGADQAAPRPTLASLSRTREQIDGAMRELADRVRELEYESERLRKAVRNLQGAGVQVVGIALAAAIVWLFSMWGLR